MLLQACLGLRVDGEAGVVEAADPRLPIGIDHFSLLKLGVDDDLFDLHFERIGERVTVKSTAPKRLRVG
jgi:predicted proteasome-type protease